MFHADSKTKLHPMNSPLYNYRVLSCRCVAQVVELSAQNVVMDSFLDTQSRSNSLQWFTHVYAYLALYGQRVSLSHEKNCR